MTSNPSALPALRSAAAIALIATVAACGGGALEDPPTATGATATAGVAESVADPSPAAPIVPKAAGASGPAPVPARPAPRPPPPPSPQASVAAPRAIAQTPGLAPAPGAAARPAGAPAAAPAPSASIVATRPIAPSVPGLSEAAAGWLDLDLAKLAQYAAPALPPHYDGAVRAQDSTPRTDPVSDRIATLGRVLFHDRRLSVNDTVACASCHQAAHGMGDVARFSAGFDGVRRTTAHAMRLGNVRYFAPGTMFWDRRAASLEVQATQPIQHPVEMGFDAAAGGMPALIAKMSRLPYYPELFAFAFGDPAITEPRIQRALAHFERAMVSTGSAWDTGYARNYDPARPDRGLGTPVAGFSAEQERGRRLFIDPPPQGGLGCAGCHVPPSFALAANSRGNGLDAGETRVFKAPSLKSVALSGAFMHDGRFATLEQVIDHYDRGVQAGPALDNRLRQPGSGAPRRLNLSPADKAALAAFLRTLTDSAFLADPKFASPFRR